MTPQFKQQFTSRDGSTVAVQVSYGQGSAHVMNERKALEQAARMIGERLEALGAGG